MNRPMMDSGEYGAETACTEYGSHGRRMPKPSIPGIGKTLSSTLTTNMKPRKASAAKKLTLEAVYQRRWPGTRNGAATTRAHSAVQMGPASETNESQARLRRAERSMYTAPPGNAIPPRRRKTTGNMKLIRRLV